MRFLFSFQGVCSNDSSFVRTFRSKNPGSKKGILLRVDYFGKKMSVSAGSVPNIVRQNDNEDYSDADSLHPKAPVCLGDATTANAGTNTLAGNISPHPRPIYTAASSGFSNYAPFVGNSGSNTLPINQYPQLSRPHIMPLVANVPQQIVVTSTGDYNLAAESTPRSDFNRFDAPARQDLSFMVEAAKSAKRRSSSGMKIS